MTAGNPPPSPECLDLKAFSPWEEIGALMCADKASEVFIVCHIFALSAAVPGLFCLFLYHKPCFLLFNPPSYPPSPTLCFQAIVGLKIKKGNLKS